MHRRFGIWLLTCPRSFQDPRIWREDKNSYDRQTVFQRAIGVRYVGKSSARYPDANAGFGSFGRRSPPKSIAKLFRGHFHRGPVRRQDLCLLKNHKEVLARSTGYALVSSPKVRHVSVGSNALFIGTLRARVDADA